MTIFDYFNHIFETVVTPIAAYTIAQANQYLEQQKHHSTETKPIYGLSLIYNDNEVKCTVVNNSLPKTYNHFEFIERACKLTLMEETFKFGDFRTTINVTTLNKSLLLNTPLGVLRVRNEDHHTLTFITESKDLFAVMCAFRGQVDGMAFTKMMLGGHGNEGEVYLNIGEWIELIWNLKPTLSTPDQSQHEINNIYDQIFHPTGPLKGPDITVYPGMPGMRHYGANWPDPFNPFRTGHPNTNMTEEVLDQFDKFAKAANALQPFPLPIHYFLEKIIPNERFENIESDQTLITDYIKPFKRMKLSASQMAGYQDEIRYSISVIDREKAFELFSLYSKLIINLPILIAQNCYNTIERFKIRSLISNVSIDDPRITVLPFGHQTVVILALYSAEDPEHHISNLNPRTWLLIKAE